MKTTEIELHPGHWENENSGATGIIKEVEEARKVTKRVYEILKASKVPTTYFEDNTSTNQSQNLNTLVKEHNKDQNGLVVSIHFNASGGTSDKGIGTEVLYYDQKELAENVAKAISNVSGLKNRGAKQHKNLAVLTQTYEPAILIEVCFVNDSTDVALYRRDFEKICYAIAKELAVYLGVNIEEGEKELQFTSPTLRKMYEERLASPGTAKLLDDAAVEVLGYKSKLINGRLSDGDLNAMAIELAVHFAKKC
ncbi:N-acetylmuramoyl-L-alanine amidase [Lysinibacillus composti]|uniref:N-acetylmuramoyl-L-alanine amidase n=1 Tax=Lysinibacillus composti TaxID=720633 RepID=A0A3N9UVI3_9BACI|nr:N-acetylmuramoyl-L-alanine amidase [Lysinibacillus composti]MBM7607589.1 N-acetylmuramoyl-L-alanine amidase [Lysinibacillus composti]RQW75906.1 N-acetylmuramoyl-L-alanine amidase [Lysinibacillus composti]